MADNYRKMISSEQLLEDMERARKFEILIYGKEQFISDCVYWIPVILHHSNGRHPINGVIHMMKLLKANNEIRNMHLIKAVGYELLKPIFGAEIRKYFE